MWKIQVKSGVRLIILAIFVDLQYFGGWQNELVVIIHSHSSK